MRQGRVPLWALLVVFAAAWLAQAPVLRADWGPHGRSLVRDNPVVRGGPGSAIRGLFRADAWSAGADRGAWRPLPLATYALEEGLWERPDGSLSPVGFRVTTLLLHALACVLLGIVLARALAGVQGGAWIAAAAALLFAVHPVVVPTLASMAGRADVLALLLALAAAWLYQEGVRRQPAWLPLAALVFFFALASKEAAIGLPLVLLALEGPDRGPAVRRFGGLLAMAAAALAWVVLAPGAPTGPVASAFEGVARSAVSVLVPLGFVRDSMEVWPFAGWSVGAFAGLAIVLAGVLAGLARGTGGRGGVAGAGLAAFVLAALPAALLAPLGHALEARFSYVVAVGLFLLLGRLVVAVARPVGGARLARAAGVAGTVLLVPALGALSWHEASAWASEDTWLAELVTGHPRDVRLQLLAARTLREDAEAERAYLRVLPTASPSYRAGQTVLRRHLTDALHLLQGLSGRHPENPTILRELGMVQLSLGQPAEAERVLRRSLRHDPAVVVEEGADMRARPEARGHAVETARAALALGKAQAGQGRQDEAVPAYRLAADLGRDDPEILGEAGAGLVRARRTAEALPLLERALRLAPSSSQSADLRRLFDDLQSRVQGGADALLRRAQRSESERNYREAAVAYEEALATDPTRIQAYIRLAWIRGYQGRYPAANEMLDRALAVVENTGGPGADDARRDIERERRALAEAQARDEAEERRMLGETTAPDGH